MRLREQLRDLNRSCGILKTSCATASDADFGDRFVELPVSLRTNDERAALKRRISQLYDSPFVEEVVLHLLTTPFGRLGI
jgi:hypothetical protein